MSGDEHPDAFTHFRHLDGVAGQEPVDDGQTPLGEPAATTGEMRAQRRVVREVRRQRTKRRKRALAIVLVVVLVVGVGGFFVAQYAGGLWGSVTDHVASTDPGVSDYPGPGSGSVNISVQPGDTGEAIATTLKDKGVIATRGAFLGVAKADPSSANIQPGTYAMYKKMRAADALAVLVDPENRIDYVITVPEGWRVDQVLGRVQTVMGFSSKVMTKAMKKTGKTGLPKAADGQYEGWLSPGQYVFGLDTKPTDVLHEMVKRTSKRLKKLKVPSADREKVLLEASIAQREAGNSDDFGKVVRVVLNRIDQDQRLQMDTIVAYGADKPAMELTSKDFADGSNPYNVYVHKGLPPSPISNPSDEAIKGALNPPAGDWLWFVTVNLDTGETRFTDNFAKFQKDVEEYKEWKAKHYEGSDSAGDKNKGKGTGTGNKGK